MGCLVPSSRLLLSRLLAPAFLALPVLSERIKDIATSHAGTSHKPLAGLLNATWTQLSRGFATETPRFGQPATHVIKAIPFLIDPSQADEAYTRYHSEQPLLAPPRNYSKSKQVFLPFWVMSGTVAVNAGTAQVGYSRTRRRMNPRTGTWETQSYVEWHTYYINRFWERRYTAEQIQMYAGSKYPSSDVDCLAPGSALIHAVPMKPDMMDEAGHTGEGAAGGRLRRVYPFTMTPDTAIKRSLEWIREQEEAAVTAIALQSHPGADQVTAIELNLSLRPDFSAHPIFVPAYVFTLVTPLLKLKMRTFVAAFPGAPVSGTRMYDGVKVGALVAALAPIALLVLGVVMPWSRLFWLGSVLPGATAGFTAHYFADLRSWYLKNVSKQQEWEVQDHRNWNAEWVREYSRLEDQRQQQQQQQERDDWERQQGSRQGSGGAAGESEAAGPPGDSKGYYSLLGVPPNASTSEIQAAFRAAAFKHHPDRYAEAEKPKATAAFQRISEAYNTLRDTNRRRQYDLT